MVKRHIVHHWLGEAEAKTTDFIPLASTPLSERAFDKVQLTA
jgi:hypothetical protein